MPWKPLPAVAFAVCVFPFRASAPNDLPLEIGDECYLIEQGGKHSDWYRGYLVAQTSLLAGLSSTNGEALQARVFSGVFPRNCVEVRELLGENKIAGQTSRAPREPVFDGADDGEGDDIEKRKSQKLHARRLSRNLSRKQSRKELNKTRKNLIQPEEIGPRDPNAPKPQAPVPLLRVGDETSTFSEEPLVDEISSCLREWHSTRLHELLLARRYSQLGRVSELVKRLDRSRKQLMHDVMTEKELDKLREDTVWDLVAGNKMLNDEVIVRSPHEKGRILTAEDSVIEMTKLQANMSILERPPKPPADKHTLYHVLVDVRTLVCEQDQPATLHMYLCLKVPGDKPRPVSEAYAVSVPLPDPSASTGPGDEPRTLFVNLSATDIGIGAEMSSLYLVFKLLREEPVRQSMTGNTGHQHQSSIGQTNGITPGKGSIKGRSSMFGSRRRRNSNTRASSEDARPHTGQSARYTVSDGRSSTSSTQPPPTGEKHMVKRTVGLGAVEVGPYVRQQSEANCRVALWTPASGASDRDDGGEDWNEIIRELTRSATGGFSRMPGAKRFEIFVKAFASLDLDSLIRNSPTYLHEIATTQKLGFTGTPSERRSDIYLTLTEPIIPRGANLAHAKNGQMPLAEKCNTPLANMQLTLEVRRANGQRIDNCIFTAGNRLGHTAWRTTAIERGEGWNETIKLEIEPEDVPGSHIVMSIADSPLFPFALAWVPLWEADAFVRDGDHNVALYVYDEYSSSVVDGKGAYLGLPAWSKKTDYGHSIAATVSLRTYLCSTRYSQDPNILGLLSWRSYHGATLISVLERFAFVPEIEVVKLLEDVFAALFEILDEYAGSETYEDLIFYDFVVVLSIARDRRFDLGSVIEQYAVTRHDWPNASQCLMRAYQRLISSPMDPEASRKLRATLKVGDQILKLIIDTRNPPPPVDDEAADEEDPDRHPTFVQDLQNIFTSLMALMRNPMPVLLGTQTLVVQHFHSWLPELASFMSPIEILEIATNLLDACAHAQGKMIMFRLVLIINYSHLDVFKDSTIRPNLIANTFRWLAPCWGETDEVTEQWRDQVRLCCSVVAAQISELGEESCQYVPKLVDCYTAIRKTKTSPKRNFSMLFPTTYPFPSKPTSSDVNVDEALLEISALLAAALTTQSKLYFDQFQVDVPGVLLQALHAGQSILGGEAFPQSWLSLYVSHHRFAMGALERIGDVLIESLPESPDMVAPDNEEVMEFNTEVWRAFLETLFIAVSSPALAMETFPEQKRRAIWKIAGDVRELGANLLRRSWEALGWVTTDDSRKLYKVDRMGGYQVQFVPELVPPVVELCLSVHAGLRTVAIEVLWTMIISDWELNEDISVIQTAMIDCLDNLCRTKNVTESIVQKAFVEELIERFAPLQNTTEDSLYRAVVDMFRKVEELLILLAAVHQGGAPNEATRIMETLRLMNFLKDMESEDAYIRYVHQLADLQVKSGNYTEAGLALQLHAERYPWDSARDIDEMTEPKMPAQKAFERKESLYFQMVKHFEQGSSWKRALEAYSELASQYEHNVFDFSKLARAQRAMASIHEKIAKGDRISPRYFRVVYTGLGFPPTLRDKQFIFEGAPSDRLATFTDKMQQLHPSARMRNTGVDAEVEGQYLQVFPVSPHKDLGHPLYQQIKVSQAVREYCLMSNPSNFNTTARQPGGPEVALTDQLVDKTIYTTTESFPTILRRSEIMKTETMTLTPIQAAIERTTRKTQELALLEKRILDGDESAIGQLSEALLIQVDPGSDSSVARYRSLLPASETDNISDIGDYDIIPREETPLEPLENALKVALLDHTLAIKRCLTLYSRPAHMATKAELVPRFEAAFESELATLFPHKTDLFDQTPRQSWIDPEMTAQTAPPVQPQPVAGAETNGVSDGRPMSPEKRATRRGSFNFLKRNSQSNGDGKTSRQQSRTREPSITRRLSAFLREDKGDEYRPSGTSHERPELLSADQTGLSSMSGSLKKRLSFIGNGSVQ